MSAAKTPLPAPTWPPLITAARLPLWVRIRDILLTLAAWGLLGWLLRDPIYVAYDWLRPPIFQLTTAKPLDVVFVLWRLRYFLMISAGLVAWLCLCAIVVYRHLLPRWLARPQPPALTLEEQAAGAGLDENIVDEARKFKVTNVRFDEDGSVASFEEVICERPPA